MSHNRHSQIAVIFASQESGEDLDGYAAAAEKMAELASRQPGYCGVDSTRGADGFGITVSYWADEESAIAWREHPEHAAIRELGRERWYARYELYVTRVERGYRWSR